MSKPIPFPINWDEKFEHLLHAPIVEAMIHWRARADRTLDPQQFVEGLKDRLPDYPQVQMQHKTQMEMHSGPAGSAASQQTQWHGFRFESEDKRQVAQFTQNGFAFSRLKPHEDWERFESEATRLWVMYTELANPAEVQRPGVRFINVVSPADAEKLGKLLTLPPRSPAKMKLSVCGFMHQTTYNVPGNVYKLAVLQTLQPASSGSNAMADLILSRGVSREAQYIAGRTLKHSRRLQESALGSESVVREELASVWEECRVPNWDEYNALPVEHASLRNAYVFLESLPFGFPQPSVGAEPDGQITLEWHDSPRRTLSVSVSSDAELHYAALLGASRISGTEPFFGEVPDMILNLIRKVRVC